MMRLLAPMLTAAVVVGTVFAGIPAVAGAGDLAAAAAQAGGGQQGRNGIRRSREQPQKESSSAAFQRCIAAAGYAIQQGDLPSACQNIRRARALASTPAERHTLDRLIDRANDQAIKSLWEADKLLAAKSYLEAIRAYQRLATLAPLPVAGQAAGRLQSREVRVFYLEKQADLMYQSALAMLQKQRDALAASAPLAGADPAPAADSDSPPATTQPARRATSDADVVAAMPPEQQALLLAMLRRIAANFVDTSTFEKMRPLLVELANDERIQGSIDRWQQIDDVRQKLDLARNYAWNRRYDRAADYYRQVIEALPDSSYGDYARYELDQLRQRYLVRP